jgi:N-acetylmuramic acid 6-phosphate etherase
MAQGFIAGGDVALRNSVEAAEDDREAGARLVASLDVNERDAVVGITASGGTPWVLGVVEEARRRGAATIGVTCNPQGPLKDYVDVHIAPVVGPEVIAGSTRMKAGSAQKMTLNMLSTAVMIRLGKVYGNLMVDVAATNAKLRRRAESIVQQVCDVDERTAREVLSQTDYSVKPALVMLLAGVDAAEAEARLERANGRVREALAIVPPK